MNSRDQTHELALKLKAYWQSVGVSIRPGVSEEALREFEAAHQVALPEEFQSYLRVVDGMEDGDTDTQPSEWFALQRINSIPEDLVQFAGIPDYRAIVDTLEKPDEWYVFIQYLIFSHVYAVRFTPSQSLTTPVIWICGSSHRPIADSFTEFLEAYLADPETEIFPANSW
jgi:hypothetical protein